MSDDEASSAPAAETEEKEESEAKGEAEKDDVEDEKDGEKEKDDDDEGTNKETVTNEDVFGDDDDDDDKPAKKSKGSDDDSDASKGGGSDSDDEPQQLTKKKKRRRATSDDDSDDDDKDDEPTPKKKKKDKEKKKKSKKRKADDSDDNSDKEADNIKDFLDSDGEEAMSGNEDEREAEKIARDGGVKKKLTKSDKMKLLQKEREWIENFVRDLKKAAFADKDAYMKKETATRKMAMLEDLKKELGVQRKHGLFLEAGVLRSLKHWLEPLDEKKKVSSLPNRKLIADVLDLLYLLPIDEEHQNVPVGNGNEKRDYLEYVTESEVGHSVMFIKKALSKDAKNTPAYRSATQVIQKWSRLIFKKSGDYKKDRDDDDDDEDERRKRVMPKANRDWEQMPENKDRDGRKFTKGDFGFRYGASVPRPMLVDFSKMPESKVEVEDRLEKAKGKVKPDRDRLLKVGVESKRAINDGRNTRAEAPELNRMHVGGVAEKVCSMGWAERAPAKKKSK